MTKQSAIERAKAALKTAEKFKQDDIQPLQTPLVEPSEDHLMDDTGHGYVQDLDGGIELVDEDVELVGSLAENMSERLRVAVTFDRHLSGLAVVKLTFNKSKLVSITKYKPDVPQIALAHANKILAEEIMKTKKLPAENN